MLASGSVAAAIASRVSFSPCASAVALADGSLIENAATALVDRLIDRLARRADRPLERRRQAVVEAGVASCEGRAFALASAIVAEYADPPSA